MNMRLLTSAESREIDQKAISQLSIPSLLLMENAALCLFEALHTHLDVQPGDQAVVVCGKGNNGGDGLALARHLKNHGVVVEVFLLADPSELEGDALTNFQAAKGVGVPIISITKSEEMPRLKQALGEAKVVVDAILGTGITGEVRGLFAQAISLINESRARRGVKVLSVDVPSGLNANSGEICGVCVLADTTVTLGGVKRGLVLFPGADCVGDLFVGDISVPPHLFENIPLQLTTESLVCGCLPTRGADTHKGNYGRVLVVGGSAGMSGAAIMAGQAALRGGAGLVTIALPQSLNLAVEAASKETMSLPLPETQAQSIAVRAMDVLKDKLAWADVVAVGPGISRHEETQSLVRELVTSSPKPVVLDADGLIAFTAGKEFLSQHQAPLIITPHPGEMAAILETSVEKVQSERIGTALEVARETKAVVVLKGARTVIAAPDGEAYVNLTGNPGLASGGTGDVLTGLIAALIAQGNPPFLAAACGVFLHGLAGDIASWEKGEVSLVAGDLLDHLPRAILQPDLWRPVSVRPLSPRLTFLLRARGG